MQVLYSLSMWTSFDSVWTRGVVCNTQGNCFQFQLIKFDEPIYWNIYQFMEQFMYLAIWFDSVYINTK